MSDRHEKWTGQEMLFACSRKGRQLPPVPHCQHCRRIMALTGVCFHCGATQLATAADYQRWGFESMIEGNRQWEKKQEKIDWARVARNARLRLAAQRKRP